MRLAKDHKIFLKERISTMAPSADIFLFGSRAAETLKGGDIDVLVLDDKKLSLQQIRTIKIAFYKKFGEQKIDIVSFKKDDPSTFKALALLEAIKL
jgi:predicted nucleotidyltransferase